MNKKKTGILIGVALVIVLCGLGIGFRQQIAQVFSGGTDSENRVYVEQIAAMNGQVAGLASRFNGVVETQDILEIKVDSSRKIDEIHVEVGDVVEEGQTLITYDTSDLKLQIDQAKLEVESINNDIANEEKQIELLSQQMASLPAEEQFAYTTEIQNIRNGISQKKYDLESKQLEINKLKTQMKNSTITSEATGTVKAINEQGIDEMGNSVPFMSILKSGDYRVKGSIDEQNVWSLSEGQPVILRSRVDETVTWSGIIAEIDTEHVEQNTNNMYGEGEVMMASKYPFYVELETSEGLILGQHVYIELDEGQTVEKEGLWLYSSYIVQNEDTAFVWAANSNNRLEKRIVELGEYNADMDQYEILSGLTEEDYIAWPMDGLYEGVMTVTNIEEENWNYETNTGTGTDFEDMESIDGEFMSTEFIDEEYTEGEYMDTEYTEPEVADTESVEETE